MKYLSFLFIFLYFSAYGQSPYLQYQGDQLQSIRVPVGGIGTGNILMGGRGNIEFIEVFNRPERQRRLEKTFFSIWIKEQNKEAQATLIERELFPPYLNSTHKYVGGLPRMQEATFTNHYPKLHWDFQDPTIPIALSLEIVNSIIPLDYEASSYPVAKFQWKLQNPTDQPIEGSLALSMENPIEAQKIINKYIALDQFKGIQFISQGDSVPINFKGGLTMATSAEKVEVQTHWYPGTWRDETHIFWDDFSSDGHLEEKKEDWVTHYQPTSYNESTHRMATVSVPFSLPAGSEMNIPFYLSWYFPQRVFTAPEVFGIDEAAGKVFKNMYATRFSDEVDALQKFMLVEDELLSKTNAFVESLLQSSYPDYVKEALNTQISSLDTNLIQYTAAGDVHGFEGVLDNGWCCPGTCTHVWNYEQTLASLFPSLERKMREIEFLNNTFADGFQAHRSVIPVGEYWFNGPAAADGQLGTIVRAYREWKLSGDDEWLAKLWPKIKLALEFAWTGSGEASKQRVGSNQTAWDPQKIGLLSNRQHNTYDISFYGPTSMTSSIYLAALKACSEMATAMGEKKKAKEYQKVFESGSALLTDSLWNGDYFIQIIVDENTDPNDPDYAMSPNAENIPKYQYGNGCLSDQLLGQYMAFTAGLGFIADPQKINSALSRIYENNFFKNLRTFANVQRVYGLNNESGVVLCTWPQGNRPALPFVYSDEIWTGVEYQVAASLIYAGKTSEGLEIVKAVQDRYDGYKRNPFEHIESGVHYARAMSSWSLLLALSGMQYDGYSQKLAFKPQINRSDFQSFWSTGSAWGTLKIDQSGAQISVQHGQLNLIEISIMDPNTNSMKSWKPEKDVYLQGETLAVSF